jgi:hypothetical protein
MQKRIAAALLANAFALATVAGPALAAALANSNCTGPKAKRPASCHESGQPGPGNFVADGGGALAPNH